MKIKLIFLTAFMFCLACKGLQKQPYIHIEQDYAEVHFERPMSKDQLQQLKQDLANIGITIDFTEITYDGDLLNLLSFVLKYKNDVGEGSTHFVHKVRPYGFIIDGRSGQNYRFIIGELPVSNK